MNKILYLASITILFVANPACKKRSPSSVAIAEFEATKSATEKEKKEAEAKVNQEDSVATEDMFHLGQADYIEYKICAKSCAQYQIFQEDSISIPDFAESVEVRDCKDNQCSAWKVYSKAQLEQNATVYSDDPGSLALTTENNGDETGADVTQTQVVDPDATVTTEADTQTATEEEKNSVVTSEVLRNTGIGAGVGAGVFVSSVAMFYGGWYLRVKVAGARHAKKISKATKASFPKSFSGIPSVTPDSGKHPLFVFDFDDTLYRGIFHPKGDLVADAADFKANAKTGSLDLLEKAMAKGHYVGIATYNHRPGAAEAIRKVMYDHLIEKGWSSAMATNALQQNLFIEAPQRSSMFTDLNASKSQVQDLFRGGKTRMFDRIVAQVDAVHGTNKISFATMADDKTPFIDQVLRSKSQIPILGLEAGVADGHNHLKFLDQLITDEGRLQGISGQINDAPDRRMLLDKSLLTDISGSHTPQVHTFKQGADSLRYSALEGELDGRKANALFTFDPANNKYSIQKTAADNIKTKKKIHSHYSNMDIKSKKGKAIATIGTVGVGIAILGAGIGAGVTIYQNYQDKKSGGDSDSIK